MLIRSETRRAGFTLVEVLVAAGLCMLIMAVMATAFQTGMDTLSHLKSIGDLQQRLRTADIVLRRDLTAQHVESDRPDGDRVSGLRFDQWVPPTPPIAPFTNWLPSNSGQYPPRLQLGVPVGTMSGFEPPMKGFFRVVQEGEPAYRYPPLPVPFPTLPAPGQFDFQDSPTVLEGSDQDGTPSTRATRHILHMAIRLPATRADQMFYTGVPAAAVPVAPPVGQPATLNLFTLADRRLNDPARATTLASRWAEVVYYLDMDPARTGNTGPTATNPTGVPTYTLYRTVRALSSDDPRELVAQGAPMGDWSPLQVTAPGVSCGIDPAFPTPANTPARVVNSPASVGQPRFRLGGLVSRRRTGTTTPPIVSGVAAYNPPTAGPADLIGPLLGSTGATGEDVLLTNVISFEVKLNYDASTAAFGRSEGAAANTLTPANATAIPAQVVGPDQLGFTTPRVAQPPPAPVGGGSGQPKLAATPTRAAANVADLIFDDLPVPSSLPFGAVAGFPFGDGNPAFARMSWQPMPTQPAPGSGMPFLYPVPGRPEPVGFADATHRRVFDTWFRAEPAAQDATDTGVNFAPGSIVRLPGADPKRNWGSTTPRSGTREAYVDVVCGDPTSNSNLLTLGRWDERFIPFWPNANAADLASGNWLGQIVYLPNPNFVPLPVRVKAIQIKIRLWDPRNQTARQITIVESL